MNIITSFEQLERSDLNSVQFVYITNVESSIRYESLRLKNCISFSIQQTNEDKVSVVIEKLHLDNATTINCCDINLVFLVAPKCEEIVCQKNNLANLHLPEAITIDCSFCHGMRKIVAPKCKTLHCKLNKFLRNISLENLENLDCSYCSISALNIPRCKTLRCSSCPLKAIVSNSVVFLHCREMSKLKTLHLPNVKTVICSDAQLEICFVPKCEKFEIHNVRMENIFLPSGKEIYLKSESFAYNLESETAHSVEFDHQSGVLKLYAPEAIIRGIPKNIDFFFAACANKNVKNFFSSDTAYVVKRNSEYVVLSRKYALRLQKKYFYRFFE